MALFIAGIDPPKNCWSCPFRINGYCVVDKERRYVGMGAEIKDPGAKMPWCPAMSLEELATIMKKEASNEQP